MKNWILPAAIAGLLNAANAVEWNDLNILQVTAPHPLGSGR
jgi:hypothetical protein